MRMEFLTDRKFQCEEQKSTSLRKCCTSYT